MRTLRVEVWSDIVCPWCYIGKRRFETARDAFLADRPGVTVEVGYRAFELDASLPPGEERSVAEVYAQKFGGPEQARQLVDRLTRVAAEEGLAFRLDRARRANTRLAHRLVVLAGQRGLQAKCVERLMAAYFVEGRSIATVEALSCLGDEVGLPSADCEAWLTDAGGLEEVEMQEQEAVALGLTGVPAFVLDRRFTVPGAAEPAVFREILDRLADP